MRRLSWLVALLLLSGHVSAQERFKVSEKPTPAEVQTANDVIKKAQSDPIILPYGGYALAEIDYSKKMTCYVVPGSDNCLDQSPMPKGSSYKGWLVAKGTSEFKYLTVAADKDKDRVLVNGIKEGTATLIWIANGATANDDPTVVAAYQFIVGKPKPPDPAPPGPNPPGPNPPIPGVGFRVLVVTETKDLSTLPSAQVQALTAKEVRDYLDSHCVKVDNQPEYRIYDKDIDLSKATQVWKDAMSRPRQSVPWIVVTNGQTGYEGPLPGSKDALMALLRQYGGP